MTMMAGGGGGGGGMGIRKVTYVNKNVMMFVIETDKLADN